MKNKIYKIMDNLKNKDYKVIKVSKTEFELDNGDVYSHTFELDDDISVEEFQELLNKSKQTMIDHLQKITEGK
jgi:hypothetical protein